MNFTVGALLVDIHKGNVALVPRQQQLPGGAAKGKNKDEGVRTLRDTVAGRKAPTLCLPYLPFIEKSAL